MRSKVRWGVPTGRRLVLATGLATLVVLVTAAAAGAETIDERVRRTVSLDAPGTATIEAFDPALGTLTQVTLTIDVALVVQACVENQESAVGATTAGAISGSLAVDVPGTDRTAAGIVAELPPADLTASNGTDDCKDGYSADARRFPGPVSASDVAYAERAGDESRTATLTSASDLESFTGTGTVTISYTPESHTDLAVPDEWDAVAVAVGSYDVEVVYTYTPTPESSTPRRSLSVTGSRIVDVAITGALLVAVGASAVLIARRRESRS